MSARTAVISMIMPPWQDIERRVVDYRADATLGEVSVPMDELRFTYSARKGALYTQVVPLDRWWYVVRDRHGELPHTFTCFGSLPAGYLIDDRDHVEFILEDERDHAWYISQERPWVPALLDPVVHYESMRLEKRAFIFEPELHTGPHKLFVAGPEELEKLQRVAAFVPVWKKERHG